MTRASLTLIAALGLSALAAPAVFATAPGTRPVDDHSGVASGVADDLTAALDDWCRSVDDRMCDAWRAESTRPHALQSVETQGDVRRAQIALRATSMRLYLEAHRTASGWQLNAVRGARTLRCGTAAFETVRAVVRGASPTWAARVDGCSPDALRPIEVERAALRPVLIQGEQSTAVVAGPEWLVLAWRDGAWHVAE